MTLREYINEGSIFEQIKRISNLHAIDNRTLYIPTKSEEIQGIIYDLPVSECIPSEIIESWSHSITQLDKYSINDLSKADEEFLSNFHWDFLIQKWDNFLGNFGTILSDNIEKQLQFQKIGDIINFLTYEGIPRLLPKMQEIGLKVDMVHQQFLSGMEILEKLETRMKMAKELIIIGSAFIKNDSIQQLTTIIQNLPIKYLKLVLIWGGLGEESPDVFKEITSIVDQSIILIKGKDLFHSKFLIIDNQIGWITSCNLLSYYYSEKSPEECICEFERGLIINDIVEYIRQLIPENSTALEWIDKTYDKYEVDPDSINTYSTFSNFHNYLENVLESLQAIRNKSNFSENLLKLKDLFENIKKSLRFFRNKETAVLIENLDHRKLLRSVLSECSSQIKIGTDRIIQNAISPVLISAFNDALARNVSISIKWGKENPKGTKKDQYEISLKGLQYLNEQTNNMLSIPQSPCHSHSKYLIMDESLSLITSYNLLAFSGNGLADDDITKELGVVITSRKITKNILDYC
jgi:phosphatidylserine/phosphatidylglycerophosphate/cardiolipin synthase-like enzyme